MRISRSPNDAGQLRSISLYDDENQPFRRQGSRESSGSEGMGTRSQEYESRIFRRQTDKQVTFEDERQYSPPKPRDSQPYQRPNQRQNRKSWDYTETEVPAELKNNPLLRSGSFHGRDQRQDRYYDQHDRRGQQGNHNNYRGNYQNRNYNRQGSYEDRRDYQRNGYDRRDNYRDIREQYRKGDNQFEGEGSSRNGQWQGHDNRPQMQRSQSREERKGFVSAFVLKRIHV